MAEDARDKFHKLMSVPVFQEIPRKSGNALLLLGGSLVSVMHYHYNSVQQECNISGDILVF